MPRILVVDEDAEALEFLSNLLRSHGCSVATARGGTRGIRKFEADRPDLAIVEVLMPEMDGIEVMAKIHRVQAAFPVIAVSGGGIRTPRRTALHLAARSGASRVVNKPIIAHELLSAVDHCLAAPGDAPSDNARRRFPRQFNDGESSALLALKHFGQPPFANHQMTGQERHHAFGADGRILKIGSNRK